MKKSLRLAALAAVTTAAFAGGAPAASAECTDLGGQGELCTTTEPQGTFGARLTAGPLNVCIVVFNRCP